MRRCLPASPGAPGHAAPGATKPSPQQPPSPLFGVPLEDLQVPLLLCSTAPAATSLVKFGFCGFGALRGPAQRGRPWLPPVQRASRASALLRRGAQNFFTAEIWISRGRIASPDLRTQVADSDPRPCIPAVPANLGLVASLRGDDA